LWKQVRPYFREESGKYEFSIDDHEVNQFCFDDSAVARLEIAIDRLRALTGLTAPKVPLAAGSDNAGDNPKKTRKRGPRGPYDAKRQADIVRGVDNKVRQGSTKQQAIQEIAGERHEKATTIKGVYYRAQRARRQKRQPQRRKQ
jgi:hypothetical protein